VDGYSNMPHLGVVSWRSMRGGLEPPSDRLSADRLGDIISAWRFTSSESATMRQPHGAPQQASVAEPSRPADVPGKELVGPVPVISLPVVAEPVVAEPVVAEPVVPKLVVAEPVVPKLIVKPPVVLAPAVLKDGRHRRPSSPKLSVRGCAFTSRRLALMGVLTLLGVVSGVFFALS
jgi:hypothetical protein